MIKDTRKGINNNITDESKKVPVKYKIVDFEDFDYYWKSRQNKDDAGNNSCHLVFATIDKDVDLRFKFLKLLIEEGVGDMNKRNRLGYLPQENLHLRPFPDLPREQLALREKFLGLIQEEDESDYMIITNKTEGNKGKLELIEKQLKEL